MPATPSATVPRVSGSFSVCPAPPPSRLDTTDPTYGIGYIYDNGDATGCPMGRTLEIDLYCQDNAYNVPTYNRVDEVSGCYYVMDMQSIYGCPTGMSRARVPIPRVRHRLPQTLRWQRCLQARQGRPGPSVLLLQRLLGHRLRQRG